MSCYLQQYVALCVYFWFDGARCWLLENSRGPSEHIIPTETGRRWNSFLIHSWSDQCPLSPLSSSFLLTIPLVGFLCFLLFLCRVFLSQSYNHTPPFRHFPPPICLALFPLIPFLPSSTSSSASTSSSISPSSALCPISLSHLSHLPPLPRLVPQLDFFPLCSRISSGGRAFKDWKEKTPVCSRGALQRFNLMQICWLVWRYMGTIACVRDKNVAPDGSFYGWPAFSQRACADSAEGVLLSPVSLLLHLGGKGLFLSASYCKVNVSWEKEEGSESSPCLEMCCIGWYCRLTAEWAEPETYTSISGNTHWRLPHLPAVLWYWGWTWWLLLDVFILSTSSDCYFGR